MLTGKTEAEKLETFNYIKNNATEMRLDGGCVYLFIGETWVEYDESDIIELFSVATNTPIIVN